MSSPSTAWYFAQHVEQLLRRSRLGERREAAQIEEERGNVRTVPRQEPFTGFGRHEVCNLRRDEPKQRRTLPFHRFEEAGVRERDRGLVGEGLNERDVIIGERLGLATHDNDHADQVILDHDRHSEHRPEEPWPGIGVCGIRHDVRYLDRPSLDRRSPGRRRPIEGMRVLSVILLARPLALVRAQVQEPVLEKPERAVVGATESLAGFGHLPEHRLKPRRASDRAEDGANRALLFTDILEFSGESRAVGRDASHSHSLFVASPSLSKRH